MKRREERLARKAARKEWEYVKCINFVREDPATGAILEIMCKVCGNVIAGHTEDTGRVHVDRTGREIMVRKVTFAHFHNYAELKIRFKDGSFHVTNICKDCLSEELTDNQAQELYDADVNHNPESYTERDKRRKAARVVAVARHSRGIV